METSEAPHRRDFARMYTSFLKQPGGLEVQLVKYDADREQPPSTSSYRSAVMLPSKV